MNFRFYDNLTNITIPFVKKPTDLALAFAIKTLKDDPSDGNFWIKKLFKTIKLINLFLN